MSQTIGQMEIGLEDSVEKFDGLPEQGDWITWRETPHLITRVNVERKDDGRLVAVLKLEPELEVKYVGEFESSEDVEAAAKEIIEEARR